MYFYKSWILIAPFSNTRESREVWKKSGKVSTASYITKKLLGLDMNNVMSLITNEPEETNNWNTNGVLCIACKAESNFNV